LQLFINEIKNKFNKGEVKMLTERQLRNPKLFEKVVDADVAASFIQDGFTVGISGFTPSGYPKAVTLALAEQVKNGRKVKINITSGASVGPEVEEALAAVGAVARRYPYYASAHKSMKKAINAGEIQYYDMHLSHTAQQINFDFLDPIDVCIVECCAITEDGNLILTPGVGNTPVMVKKAKHVIVELNTFQPPELEGMHDIYIQDIPPHRTAIPIKDAADKIGTPYVECGSDKIKYIVETDIPDKVVNLKDPDKKSLQIAGHLIDLLKSEVKAGRLPENLLPLQSGVGSIANAVLRGFVNSDFKDLTMYSEILQDSVFDLIDVGKIKIASGCAFTPSPNVLKRFKADPEKYKKHLILRPLDITNHPEIIRRLGIIAMNTAIEIDVYGNENSTHVMGTHMMNGIGGSGDFMRNAYLSIFCTTSTAKDDQISRIVPMCTHIDSTEHDTQIVVTEWGCADLRCLAPRERSRKIINTCAHPKFRDQLMDYILRAKRTITSSIPLTLTP
jgi:succinyl-CoA:acetate CoA-transferase